MVPILKHLIDPSFDEFSPLCRYLGLPNTLLALLDGIEVESLFKRFVLVYYIRTRVFCISELRLNSQFYRFIDFAVRFRGTIFAIRFLVTEFAILPIDLLFLPV